MILDTDGKEVVQAGQYYGPGWTNNKAESFALSGTPFNVYPSSSRR